MRERIESRECERQAEQRGEASWADVGVRTPRHELLKPYIERYTFSVGCIREQKAKFITRAYPTVMTHLYIELCGGLSEVKDGQGAFAFANRGDRTNTTIDKRTYIKQGLGSWFDIHQLPSRRKSRPIKNLKVDLFPSALYQLFQLSPKELSAEDLQLPVLLGATASSLMLEEMEAAVSGEAMVDIVERYFLDHLLHVDTSRSKARQVVAQIPTLEDTLASQARRYHKCERWLQKHYAEVYGMSFKQMQKNLKFQRAHQALSHAIGQRQPVSLTELALRFGYFDQAHYIKDFKRYTGMTPGQYLKSHVEPGELDLFYW